MNVNILFNNQFINGDLDPDDNLYTFDSPSKYYLCDEFNNDKSITERKKHCFSMPHFNSRDLYRNVDAIIKCTSFISQLDFQFSIHGFRET